MGRPLWWRDTLEPLYTSPAAVMEAPQVVGEGERRQLPLGLPEFVHVTLGVADCLNVSVALREWVELVDTLGLALYSWV